MNDKKEETPLSDADELNVDIKNFTPVKDLSQNGSSITKLITDNKTSAKYVSKTINESEEENYSTELFQLSNINHPTIVKFIGYSKEDFDEKPNFTLIQEYAQNGSLYDFILKNQENPNSINSKQKLIILLGIARGMMLLHKCHIVHGNLKPQNILLNEQLYPLIDDFVFSNNDKLNSLEYLSPEALNFGNDSKESDVYSFGIIMYQVTKFNLFLYPKMSTSFKLGVAIKEGLRPNFDFPIESSLKKLIEDCWSNDDYERPSFETIFNELSSYPKKYFRDIENNEIEEYIKLIKKDDIILCNECDQIIAKKDVFIFSGEPYHKKCIKCACCYESIDSDEKIEKNGIFIYSEKPYHRKCIKCKFCHTTITSDDEIKDFICTSDGSFVCKLHYKNVIDNEELPKDQYKKVCVNNFIDEELKNKNIIDYTDIQNYPPEEVLIPNDMIEDTFQVDRPFDVFLPTIEFHFDNAIDKIDFNKIQQLLSDNAVIIKAESGCTIVKIALIATNEFYHLEERYRNIIEPLKDKLKSSLGRSIVGNFAKEPKLKMPSYSSIMEFFRKKPINLLQNTIELNQIDIEHMKQEARLILYKEKNNENFQYILKQEALFDAAEKQIRKDIQENAYEMIVVGQTIVANKYFDEYTKIKSEIPAENLIECFLYHGSRLKNHERIIKEHFIVPNTDNAEQRTDNAEQKTDNAEQRTDNAEQKTYRTVQQTDEGYFGKGVYATDNIFYASMYGNGFKVLNYNDKTSIFCCRVIYDETKKTEVKDRSFYGKEIEDKYGVHHAFVGDQNDFFPIKKDDIDRHFVVANEYVFQDNFQIIPFCSFTLKRIDHFVLWKDENIQNEENKNYYNELSKQIEPNFYVKDSVDGAIELIEKKKHNMFKLITNGGFKNSGKDLIQKARDIVGSKFVCLVFSNNIDHMNWIKKMENVLFTRDPEYFKKFVKLKMTQYNVLKFIHDLERSSDLKFNIDKNQLLNFPLTDTLFNKEEKLWCQFW